MVYFTAIAIAQVARDENEVYRAGKRRERKRRSVNVNGMRSASTKDHDGDTIE